MNLEQCLRDVETGTSGKAHADWLRELHERTILHSLGWEKSALLHTGFWVKARADAVKTAQECRELERGKSILKDALNGARKQFWEVVGERDKLQAELQDVRVTNQIFEDCLDRAGTYRNAGINVPDNEWPEGAKLFSRWVVELEAERDKLRAELEKCQLQAEKSHAAWFHGQEQAEELREELRGECAHNELLQSEMVTMSHELDELKVRADKSARNFHEIQDLLVEQRNAARAELKELEEI